MKDKLLHLGPHKNKKGTQNLVGLLGFEENIFSSVYYSVILLSDQTICFEWGLEQEKTLKHIQAVVKAALSLGPYDPSDPMVLKVSVQLGMKLVIPLAGS